MNKNLVICPSRGRPFELGQMITSFKLNSVCSDLCIIIDSNDPCYLEYDIESMGTDVSVNFIYSNTTDIINWAFRTRTGYKFYSVTNDDFVYITPGWDETLCQQGKICYGNDLLAGKDMPTTSVIDGDIVRALGWLQMPELKFMFGDAVWKSIGHQLNILKYHPEVLIEHRHWGNQKRAIDTTSIRTNAVEIMQDDNKAFRNWLHTQSKYDINLIKEMLDVKSKNQPIRFV